MNPSIKPLKLVLAVALLRVSSDRQYQEGHGIENQRKRSDYYANRNGITIVRYFIEHYSGRKTDRYVLEEIIDYIKSQNGSIKQLIISDIDRFTRAGSDTYLMLKKEFAKLGVDLVDVSGVIQKPINTLEHLGVEYD